MQYCSLQHQTLLLSLVTSTTGCWFCFCSLSILSGVVSPVISSNILGHLLTWGVHLSVSYLFAFSYCSQGSQVSIQKWFAIPSPGNYILSEFSPVTHPSCVALTFIELDILISLISLNQWITREVPYESFLVFSGYEEICEI